MARTDDVRTLQSQIAQLDKRLWALEHPPKFVAGDHVYLDVNTKNVIGVVVDVQQKTSFMTTDDILFYTWGYSIWIRSAKMLLNGVEQHILTKYEPNPDTANPA
jgi:hypothetical protein